MIFYHKLLLAPNPGKRKLLFAGMKAAGIYSSMKGMVMSLEPNPQCRDYCLLLKRRFAGAVPLAASLIIQYQKKAMTGRACGCDLPRAGFSDALPRRGVNLRRK